MELHIVRGPLAGFHAQHPDADVPELLFVGEKWESLGFALSEHTHPVWEFYVQASGHSCWQGPEASHDIAPGGFYAAAPGTRHQMRPSSGKQHFLYAALDLDVVLARHPTLAEAWRRRSFVSFERGESLLAPFRALIREVGLLLPHRSSGVRLALDALVLEATRLWQDPQRVSLVALHPAVMRARELMQHQPGGAWTLQVLGRMTNLSPNHLAELFASEVGMPPRRFLLEARIRRAREMLECSDASVTQIALELGFCSSQHFARAFKQLTGQTARDYRSDQKQI